MADSLRLTNGKIYALGDRPTPSEAMAISGGVVSAIGTLDEVEAAAPEADATVDLQGRVLLPSFADNLGRLRHEALTAIHADLTKAAAIPEVFATVERYAKALPQGEWIVGHGWTRDLWAGVRFPHRADLDLVSPHHPVALFSADLRVVWVNSAALATLGINRSTPNPTGGEIDRDRSTHAATGIFLERAIECVLEKLPPPNADRLRTALISILTEIYPSLGVTHVESFGDEAEAEMLLELAESDGLPLDVTLQSRNSVASETNLSGASTGAPIANGLYRGGIWVHVDGTLSSRTAWMIEPYADDWDQTGIQIATGPELEKFVRDCAGKGVSPTLHATGDAACLGALHSVNEIGNPATVTPAVRPAIAGGDMVRPEDLPTPGELEFDVLSNPRTVAEQIENEGFEDSRRDAQDLSLKRWSGAGARLAFGSGRPIGLWNPLHLIRAAIFPAKGRSEESALDRKTAIEAMCRRRTRIEGRPDCGLETGAPADLVILSGDPFECSDEEFANIEVVATIRAGKVIYQKEGELKFPAG